MTSALHRNVIGACLSALFLTPVCLAAEEPSALSAVFLGNEAFRITDGEVVLFTDFPYESGAFGYMTWDEALLEPTGGAYCLITHAHRDHFAAELIGRLGCTVVGPGDVVGHVTSVKSIEITAPTPLGPMKVIPFETPHNVEHLSYRVEWGGISLYFTGDTETTDVLRTQEPLDVLFISPWLFDTALVRGELPPAGRTVIYHHRARQSVPACTACADGDDCTPCRVPAQGEVLDLPRR